LETRRGSISPATLSSLTTEPFIVDRSRRELAKYRRRIKDENLERELEQRYGIWLRFVPKATALVDVILLVLHQVRPRRIRCFGGHHFRSVVDVHRRAAADPKARSHRWLGAVVPERWRARDCAGLRQ